jgi:hypothetical protein
LDIEVAQYRIPEPRNVGRGSSHQLVVGAELMLIDELLEIRLRDELWRRMPDKIAAKLKFTHALSLRWAFNASKRDWVAHASGMLAISERIAFAHGRKVRFGEDAETSTRDACATQRLARWRFIGRLKLQLFREDDACSSTR